MCDICGRQYCPGGCPGDDGEEVSHGLPVAECAVCGSKLYRGERAYCRGEKNVCAECSALAETDTLLELTESEDTGELLEALGFLAEIL